MGKKQIKKKQSVRKQKPLIVSGKLHLVPPPLAVEITRSFTRKVNLGNYESVDFFCSEKSYAKPSEAERVSESLYAFCKREVLKSVNQFRLGDKKKVADVSHDEAEHENADE